MRIVLVSGESYQIRGDIIFVKTRVNGSIKMKIDFIDSHGKKHYENVEDIVEIRLV
jgi:hypothetical protein